MDNPRIKFYVEKESFWAHSASILLGMATVFQLIGCWGLWTDRLAILTRFLVPLASYMLFVLVLNLLGKKALWLTVIPFLGGIAFHGYNAWTVEDKLVMVIGITYCVLAAVLYCGTVFALIRTKWLLVPLFGIPFCYRAFYRDVLLLQDLENPVHFSDGMREMSLLCVLLAMTLLALGMKKLVKERKKKASDQPETTPAESAPAPVPAPAPAPAPAGSVEENAAIETPAAETPAENGET